VMEERVDVIVIGNREGEHFTYVGKNNNYFRFYTDGYEGDTHKEVIAFLKFLGFEVLEIYRNNHKVMEEYVAINEN